MEVETKEEEKIFKNYIKYKIKPLSNVDSVNVFKGFISFIIVIFLSIVLAKGTRNNILSVFLLDKGVTELVIIYWILLIVTVFFGVCFFVLRRYRFQFWQYLIFLSVGNYYYLIENYFLERNWKFIDICGPINVVDPFFYGLIVFFFLKFLRNGFVLYRGYEEWRKKSDTIFLEDNPLGSEVDTNSYKNLLQQINPILYTDKYEKSFSVAIVGAWGSGKSSFIKALTKNIEDYNDEHLFSVEKQVLHFNFSPFLNHDENSIIKEFFTKLSHVLGKRSGKLSNQLLAYSKKLTNLAKEGDLLSFLTPVQSELFNQSAHELYESISDTIESLNVKIVITIDDLDRLSGNEILEVLKLIRNTSNFPNTVFFVALDKDYVIKAIGSEKDKATEYLDKFFQMELTVSKMLENDILSFIAFTVRKTFEGIGVNADNLNEITAELLVMDSLSFCIVNYRDAKRFHNQFLLDFKLLNSDVNSFEIQVKDIVNLTILKLKCPEVFNKLIYNEDLVFGHPTEFNFIHPNSESYSLTAFEKVSINDYVSCFIESETNGYRISDYYIEPDLQSSYLLIKLFGDFKGVFVQQDLTLSVKTKEIYRYYFSRTISDEVISSSELKKVLNSGDQVSFIISKIAYNQKRLRFLMEKLKYQKQNLSFVIKVKLETLKNINVLLEDKEEEEIRFERGDLGSIVDDLGVLNEDDINKFNKVFSEILNDNSFVFERKSRLISDVVTNLASKDGGKLNLSKELMYAIESSIKENAAFLTVLIRNSKDAAARFVQSYNYLGRTYGYSFRDIMYNSFKENFNRINLIEFCKFQLQYDKDYDSLKVSSFISSVLRKSEKLKEVVTSHKEYNKNKEVFDEFLKFYDLYYLTYTESGSDGIKYYFKYFPFPNSALKKDAGEVFFQVSNNDLFENLKGLPLNTDNVRVRNLKEVDSLTGLVIVSIKSNFNNELDNVIKNIKHTISQNGYHDDNVDPKSNEWTVNGVNNVLVNVLSKQCNL